MGISMNAKSIPILFFLFLTICFTVRQANAVVEISALQDGTIHFVARDSNLVEIAKKLYDEYAIEVKGLDKREGGQITFSFFSDTPEDLIKRLLRYLGIKNYAFEFSDATLKRLVVVPEETRDTSQAIEPARGTK